MDKKSELRVIRELILWLWRTHKKPWEVDDDRIREIAKHSLKSGRPFSNARDLERSLPSPTNITASFPPSQFLYLNYYEDRGIILPRISLKCDFGRNIPDVRCRLELLYQNDNDAPRGLGYRFDPPERANDPDRPSHNYYHVQLRKPLGMLKGGEWLPETQPAFPIYASNSVQLILALLISLYGLNYLDRLMRDASREINNLNAYIKQVQYRNNPSLEWYWKVRTAEQEVIYFHTPERPKSFKHEVKLTYPGCTFQAIMPEDYQTIPDNEKSLYKKEG